MPSAGEPNRKVSDREDLKGVPVLVVEDAWHVAKALNSFLEQLEMDVIGPTPSASQARQLVAKQRPKIALVDINLKQEMACDLIDELHGQGVQVIVVSGYALPPVSVAKTAGFLQKPFSGRELISTMCSALARHH
jgi:two-component system, response regulator PdtaR